MPAQASNYLQLCLFLEFEEELQKMHRFSHKVMGILLTPAALAMTMSMRNPFRSLRRDQCDRFINLLK